MKKFLSAIIAALLVLSFSATAFAATAGEAEKPLNSAVRYLYKDKDGFTAEESKDFYLYLMSGADASKYKDGWCESVKTALENESLSGMGNLAIVISDMVMLDIDFEDFYGMNLATMFADAPMTEYDNPYLDMYSADTAAFLGFNGIAEQLCDRMVSKYTLGVGTDFWGGFGTSPDDLAVFIITLTSLYDYDEYKVYIDDAMKLLKTFRTENGYDNYGANADSTAYALAAAVSAGDKETADDAFDKLMLFYDKEEGCFVSDYDNIIATKSAVFGISYYMLIAEEARPETTAPETEKPTASQTEDEGKSNIRKSPATGTASASAAAALLASGTALLLIKKKHN